MSVNNIAHCGLRKMCVYHKWNKIEPRYKIAEDFNPETKKTKQFAFLI